MKETTVFIGYIFLICIMLVIWPLCFIWAINTLFGFGIAYGFTSWLSVNVMAIWLSSIIRSAK